MEVRLFAPLEGVKAFEGALTAMDEQSVTVALDNGALKTLPRKAVALIRPVIEFDDEEE